MVTRDEWKKVLSALTPDAKLRLTFQKDTVQDVMYLVGMVGRIVKVERMTHACFSRSCNLRVGVATPTEWSSSSFSLNFGNSSNGSGGGFFRHLRRSRS